MHITRVVLSVAAVPLLGGCMMMGGIGHAGGSAGMAGPAHVGSPRVPASLERVEASSEGLTLELSFPPPTDGAVVEIDARLRADGVPDEAIDGEVRLRIRTPDGSVDEIRMQRLESSTGTYRARYDFAGAGLYLLTAEGRVGAGSDAPTVSVTGRVEVGREAHGGRHDWLGAASIVGGLGMAALMVVMMGGD